MVFSTFEEAAATLLQNFKKDVLWDDVYFHTIGKRSSAKVFINLKMIP